MKEYTVYFIIKKHSHGYLNQQNIEAKNQKEAIKLVKEKVKKESDKNAFSCSCKAPIYGVNGLEYNGMYYMRFSESFNTLW